MSSSNLAQRRARLTPEQRERLAQRLAGIGLPAQRKPAISPREPSDRAPLSYAQQRHWFLWQLEPLSTAYHLSGGLRLTGKLDIEALRLSFEALFGRHESLRTIFRANAEGLPEQDIEAEPKLDIPIIDFSGLPAGERTTRAHEEASRISGTPFDLTQGPLLRVALIRIASEEHLLVVVMHHIISDAWSNRIVIDEFVAGYRARTQGQEPVLPALPIQYADYAIWQRNWLEAGEKDRQLAYWRGQLGDEHPVLQLPTDHPRPAIASYRAAGHTFTLPATLVARLQRQVQSQGATLFMALLAGFQALLQRYTGQNDIRVGVPIANRHRVEIENIVGFFVNTQVLRSRIDGRMPFRAILDQTREAALGAQAHQDLPFEQLVEALQPERNLNQNPLFQVMYNHLREDYRALEQLPGLVVEEHELGERAAQFELTLDTVEQPDDRLEATFTYAAELFEPETIKRLGEHYLHLLGQLAEHPERNLGDVELLSEAERAQLKAWGVNERRYGDAEPVHRLIERQVEARPEAVALIFGDIELSYGELNRRANRLAHHLIGLGVKPEVKVGIAVERSLDMIVGLLSILKAGGAYVPLDPEYPRERLDYMVRDSAISLLLTQSPIRERIPHREGCEVLELDGLDLQDEPEHNPAVSLHGDNLAYVIYTSGSTGKPKGVGLPHHALVEHAQVGVEFFGLSDSDRMLQFSTINFDGFIEQLFPPLCAGAAIVLRGPMLWDSETFYRELISKRITVADLTTAYWFLLVQDFAKNGLRDYGLLRQVHAGGEAMPPEGLKAWYQAGLSDITLLNTYGPTEATVTATVSDCSNLSLDVIPAQVAIGKPLAGRNIYLLDANLTPVPPGIPGELCIGGDLLARGYLNRGGLTAERFIADPFDEQGGRLYRTGDLVRWRADGQIEYLGRLDHQVKIRGFRIELGEIEAQLLAQPEVREAVVIAGEGPGATGGKRLIAYVSPHAGHTLDTAALREAVSKALPDYMIPSAIVVLENLPLNPNGKVDRKVLPEPEFANTESYEASQGEVEEALAGIWAEVLGIGQVGRNDNFFELGGDSILSLQIVTKSRRAGWKITPRQLFERQTVSALAAVAEATETIKASIRINPADEAGTMPLLPIQVEFFEQDIPVRHHWNQAALLKSRQPLHPGSLAQALEAVVHHHDALRFRYIKQVDGSWQQISGELVTRNLLWARKAASAEQLEALCNEAQRSLNLTEGPLLRGLLIDMADGAQRLLLVIHHLVIDGVSWRILLEDLEVAYSNARNDESIFLPPKTTSYQEWTHRLQSYPCEHPAELAYWQSLADMSVALPKDNPQGPNSFHHQASFTLTLDRMQTQALLKQAPAAYRTQVNDLLLTALGSALCQWSGHEKILVDLEGHGREDLYADIDLSQTVGWFTTLYPVALDPSGDLDQRIKRIKENLRRIPNRGLGYGLFKYHGTPEQREALACLPKAEVVFNYLGQLDGSFDEKTLWVLTEETVGDSIDEGAPLEHDISINGHVYEGELRLNIRYSQARYARATIEAFLEIYQRELELLIAHCTSGISAATPSDFPLARITQQELDALSLPAGQLEDLYPLSPMQSGMLFHSVFHTDGDIYLNQVRVDIEGLDVTRFKAAWQASVDRHEVLRTGFAVREGEPLQWVAKSVELPFVEHDWRDRANHVLAKQGRDLETLAESEHASGLDLTRPPLMRLTLVRLTDDKHHFIWTSHHLLLDGWSTPQLVGEVLRHYGGNCPEPAFPAGQFRYRNFIEWLQNRDTKVSEAYWRERLRGIAEPTRLAGVCSTPSQNTESGNTGYGKYTSKLGAAVTEELVRFSRRERVTLNTLVQAAWAMLLNRYMGKQTVVFGATVAGRPSDLPGAEHLLGLFINTLPVTATLKPEQEIGAWLRDLQAQNVASREHEHTPLYEIQRWAGQSGQGLFDSILVFENYPMDEALQQSLPGGLVFSEVRGREDTNYPMALSVIQTDALRLEYGYARRHFSEDVVSCIAVRVERLLRQITRDSTRRLGDVELLSEAERAQLKAWGVNERRYGDAEPVHRLIERQVEARPEAVALIFGDIELSYGELNRRANRLAHHLIGLGVKPEIKVGIAVERSLDMIVGLLSILKAGGAYVPLDPEYPRERLDYMVRDSAISLLLTQSPIRERIPHREGCEVLELDGLDLQDEPEHNPAVSLHGDNLAYVIYTSGSTGKPKGVGVAHEPLSMHVQAIGEVYGMTPADRELQFASINFDGAHERWLVPLAFGSALMPRDNDLWPVDRTADEIAKHRITIACFTPGYLHQLAELTGSAGRHLPIRSYTVGGEATSRASFDYMQETLQPPRIINGYGPTETVITPLISKAYPETRFESAYMPIGCPVGDRTAYILDAYLNPVPLGVAGELYLGGIGLARGYLNRGGLTAERFIADPFDEQGGRLYRTGDLVRWRADGQIEYLGRLDHQVKIRGFRIELGEIEAQLLAQPEVREAVVIAGEGPGATGGKRLIAYVSPHAGHTLDTAALREAVSKALPDYMIPSAIVVLENLPLNPNGKVDRKVLPEPEFANTESYEASQGEVEEALAGIWAEVLGIGQVGRNDNFFELGGDSILSLQIVTKSRRAGWKITPRQLFERQTVSALAAVAEATETIKASIRINPADEAGTMPLLPIQVEFFEQDIPVRHHWNQAALLKSRQPLHPGSLAQALEAVVHHHDALRFRYIKQVDGSWQQISGELVTRNLLWARKAASAEQLEALCNEAQRSLNLTEGPLLRGLLIDMADGAQRLLLVIHHLVIDGVSWRILLEDLEVAYSNARNDESIFLPPKTTSYQEWTHRLQSYPCEHPAELAYWQSLADMSVALPKDNPQGPNSFHHQASFTLTLDRMQTQALLKQAPAAYRTQVNDLLLTALGSALCQWSGHEKILVDLEGHGREDLYADIDLSQTVGWFTTLYPVALDPSGDLDQRIKRIKENLRRIPNRGLGYGLFKYHGTPEQREALACLPKAEVVFNYLGQLDGSFDEKTLWVLTEETVGDSIDEGAPLEHDISINGHVYEGELRLNIRYSQARYARATIEAFLEIYQRELELLIAHCTSGISAATPSDFPLARITQQELDALSLPAGQLEDLYPLSPMQSGMLFHSVFDNEAGVYLNQLRVDIEAVDIARFKAAWQAAIDRHEILRTGFLHESKTPLQWVAKTAELPCVEYDWWDRASHFPENQERDLDALARSEHVLGFDLEKPSLMRLALVRVGDNRYHVIWTVHHLLLDGWSTSQLLGEVLSRYAGKKPPASRSRYRDFIAWLGCLNASASESYWKERLQDVAEPTRLATALSPVKEKESLGYGEYVSEMGPDVTEGLVQFAKRERVTLNTLVQAAWALLLSRYIGREKVVFGVTVAGRPADLAGAEHLLGLFINTLPVVAAVAPEQETGAWMRDLQAQNLASREHEHTPLYEIQRWTGQSGQGWFDNILVFENYPMDEALKEAMPGGLIFSNVSNREASNYPMMVSVTQASSLCLNYSYARKHFSRDIVSTIAAQVNRLLVRIAQDSAQQLGDVELLSEAERAQLKAWGVNERRYGDAEPVHRLIERQVEARPEAVALIFGDIELSYGELNRRANRLAHHLIGLGVKPEVKVGIAVERSLDMIVGLLSILKAGGAYVPLDPEYPRERLDYMVRDSAISLLLTQSPIRERIPHREGCEVLELDGLDLQDEPEHNPAVSLHGDNLAYVIYTSGSTGKPKGVTVRHQALSHFLISMRQLPGIDADDTLVSVTALSFDIAALELYVPLIAGARVVLTPQTATRDGLILAQLLATHQPNLLQSTPAGWRMLLAAGWKGPQGEGKKSFKALCGGETLQIDLANQLRELGVELWNMYGPTETTIWSVAGSVDKDTDTPSLGTPVAGTNAYILDAYLNPVPQGVAGELYLGGIGLARGYLNRGGLSAERFIADPFDDQGGRLYRTGDVARWRADGQIEYLGRLDHQVKVRGFRIELGEIEAQLLAQAGVREAVAIAREGASGTRLIAYVSLHAGAEVEAGALREGIAKVLPDYMLPSAIIVLEALPLNPNGKVDRKALPEPELAHRDNHEPPQGEVEEALAGIWAAVLGIGQVGRNDNFFEMGGDSILSLQIVTKARRAGWKITPRQLFERQNIAALAELVETIQESNAVASERGYLHDYVSAEVVASLVFTDDDIDDVYPLSPTQEGMLFHTLESAEEGTGLYVNQLSVEVEGLDPERLASAWQAMVRRHPVLRTGFLWQAGLARPLQIVFRQASVPIVPVVHLDWSGLDQLESRIAAYADEDLKREFDFLNPPLVRLSLIRIAENRHRLIWTRHHILLDGWSDTRLISEWLRSYDNEILEPRGPDYGNYVRWLARQNVEATRDFWQTELLGLEGPTLLAKPATKATAKEGRSGFAQIYTRLTPEETRQLQAFAQRQRVTVNTIVQAAWGLLLQRHTGRETVVFGATVAGRPPSLPNSEEILGLFINTIPVPIGRRSNLSVAEHLGLLQQTNARLREHEHASLADVQRWAGSPGQPLFDSIVVFENYPVDEALRGNEFYGLRFGEVEGKGLTGYAMDLQVVIGDTLEIEYAYGRKDFADEFVLELRDHMELVIREMMAHPQRAMGELGWMGWAGLDSVFSLGRNQHVDRSVGNVPRHAVHHAIEQNALSRPGAIALLMDEQELCYSELNLRANRLAHHLISLGARTEIRIGVAMERSLDVIVALLAVLKAGAAYVPLDPEYPVERLSFMMEDSALSILITQSKVLPKLGAIKAARTVVLDTVDLGDGPDSNPQVSINEHNLAYVIYTSGSTGIPKGVAVTHGPLAMHCRATAEIYGMSPRSCELLFMSFSFDGAHERWLTALTVGAGLAVRDQELWTAEQTYRALHDYGITNAAFPPAYLGQVAEWAAPRSDPPPVELYVFGGEAMPKASYDLVRRTLRPRILINGYGPTETVVTPLIWRTEASSSFDCAYAPIGRPVGERAAYVLDVDMQPVPKGVVGELYIGGYGLARGYLGRAGLTAERFVADPFDEKGGGRLYRTGDLVRWLDDGNIEYIGRNDHQVKIRGFRIELGEIEARIREVTGVAEAAVVVHAGAAGHQLTAYVVPAPGAQSPVLTARLKQELAGRLPEYMIPAHIIAVAALPRLTSGKLDRQALPEPGVTDAAASDTYCAPSTREARLLAGIWQEVLGVERVGETDNFFALGGDSLSSLKVMARMRNLSEAKFDLKLRDLMQRPTIAGLLGLDLQAQQRTQALLALNLAAGKGHAQPLFCIHAGLGTVFDYQPLARQLQAKRTVYGLPCRMLADHTYNDVSLDQMAKDYSGIIRSMQPEGTYHLLGWSLGGTLAAMIAARLEAEGQTVAFLGLIDSFIPGDEQSESDDWRCDFSDFVSLVVPGAKPGDVIQDDLPDGECATESEQPSEQAITGLLEDLISAEQIRVRTGEEGNTEAGGYADMGAEELARIFIVARQLKALSLQASALSPLQVQATCWWAATRPLSDRLALALQIEQETLQSIELDADHFAIVRTESLLLGVESTLAATSDCVTKAEEVD